MVIIIWLFAIGFAVYMLQKNLIRTEERHERSRERFERLLEQLRKQDSETSVDPIDTAPDTNQSP